ncbi:hypothetical protein LP52_15610 [Streptomonospora alba]|uniref:Methyltransferase type 12 domain-containing protein n=1 Tax=Streptomonospora alba TaxID=183763 RepID=A0A0C2JMT9_9ACTN|nr:hypothetical protein LP52_15610 [Streptomonospora alba]
MENQALWSRHNMVRRYDLLVTHGTIPWVWRCPPKALIDLYSGALSPGTAHLEVAPGSGYTLAHVLPHVPDVQLHLLDLHTGALEASAQRLASHAPALHRQDALAPWTLDEESVDSVGASMLVHCLPGARIADKTALFDNAVRVLRPGGVFVGATVLAHEVPQTRTSLFALRRLNRRSVFANSGDRLTDLAAELHTRFDVERLSVTGSVAQWRARRRA